MVPTMERSRTIDIHAHMLPQETIRRLGEESPRVAPKLIAQADGSTTMEIAGKVVQRPMPPECWDLDLRLADMDQHGIDMQAICATVHTFFYDVEPELGAACAVLQNDEIAAVVTRHSDRFVALATLPLQDPQRAADELRRAMRRARIARRPDRFERQRQEPRRSRARGGVGGGERIAGVHSRPPARRNPAGRPAQVVLYAQLRRIAVRDHHGRRGAGLRRRDRALSRHQFLPVPRRRLPAVSSRTFHACLQRARRGEGAPARVAARLPIPPALRHDLAFPARARVPHRGARARPRSHGQRLPIRHG